MEAGFGLGRRAVLMYFNLEGTYFNFRGIKIIRINSGSIHWWTSSKSENNS